MNKHKLLVVDDEEDACATLSDILNDLGYEVDCAIRGAQALNLIEKNSYRLALLDYRLPCMTGVELFQRMRQSQPGIEALLVTAFASEETVDAASKVGLREIVHKPVDVPQLLTVIKHVVG